MAAFLIGFIGGYILMTIFFPIKANCLKHEWTYNKDNELYCSKCKMISQKTIKMKDFRKNK